MRKFILKEEANCIFTEDFDNGKRERADEVIATLVPDSCTINKIYFLVGNSIHGFYFTNLRAQALGSEEYKTIQEAIEKRIQGKDCCCNGTEVYLFKSIKEAIKKLGG